MTYFVSYLLPTGILLAGLVDDLKTKKIHNWLFLSCLGVAILCRFFQSGAWGLGMGSLGGLCALACFLPLVILRALGAGDMKLMVAFGMATNWNVVFSVFVFSLFWGAALGLVKWVISGEFSGFFNISKKFQGRNVEKIDGKESWKIPYTVALFLGWLSHGVYESLGGV